MTINTFGYQTLSADCLLQRLQALLHAGLGAWLRAVAAAERQQQGGEDDEAPSPIALPAPLLWAGRMAVAFGSLVVVLLVSADASTLLHSQLNLPCTFALVIVGVRHHLLHIAAQIPSR